MPSAEVLLPQTPSAAGFSAHTLSDVSCWSSSKLFTSEKSTWERQNLLPIHLSQFTKHARRKREAELTDHRAEARCNLVLRRQRAQFLQQTLIWSKVVLLAIYFCWSHRKRVLFCFKLDFCLLPSGKSRPDKWFSDKTVSFFFQIQKMILSWWIIQALFV